MMGTRKFMKDLVDSEDSEDSEDMEERFGENRQKKMRKK